MTFDKLHDGLLECNCVEVQGETQNTIDTFARRIRNKTPSNDDFKSYYEEERPFRLENTCRNQCNYRGVSINKINNKNEVLLKSDWAEMVKVRPRLPRLFCKFKFKENAGIVWDTSNNSNPSHHTFLKCDDFTVEYLELVEVSSLV